MDTDHYDGRWEENQDKVYSYDPEVKYDNEVEYDNGVKCNNATMR